VIRLLNEALATGLVFASFATSTTRPWPWASTATPSRPKFAEHAVEEQGHADLIAARITQLGGIRTITPTA